MFYTSSSVKNGLGFVKKKSHKSTVVFFEVRFKSMHPVLEFRRGCFTTNYLTYVRQYKR